MTTASTLIVPDQTVFKAVRAADLAGQPGAPGRLHTEPAASLLLEPGGTLAMPRCHVTNPPDEGTVIRAPSLAGPDGSFPTALDYPPMLLTSIADAYCLPKAPPFLLGPNQIVSDYIRLWAPENVAWFQYRGNASYRLPQPLVEADVEYDLDAAFYLDHAISDHFGHFIGDCLCRVHAWQVCQHLFPGIKVILFDNPASAGFQSYFLDAAGVPDSQVIRIHGLVRCRRLLLATPSLGLERYASPAGIRLFTAIRDRWPLPDAPFPDRVYLSRGGIRRRGLVNEADVEAIFLRHGFAILRPEDYPQPIQLALMRQARLVAGCGGSAMFNLAFQDRLRSAFILRPRSWVYLLEMLACAGHDVDLWYHLGRMLDTGSTTDRWAVDTERLERDVADWLDRMGT